MKRIAGDTKAGGMRMKGKAERMMDSWG